MSKQMREIRPCPECGAEIGTACRKPSCPQLQLAPEANADCKHEQFDAHVGVHRLTDVDGGSVTGYTAGVRVHCAQCGKQFQFLGLEPGVDTQGARVSLDGLEARLALTPDGMRPSPLQRLAFGVERTQ